MSMYDDEHFFYLKKHPCYYAMGTIIRTKFNYGMINKATLIA